MQVDLVCYSAFRDLKAIKETALKLGTEVVILADHFQKKELLELKKKIRPEKFPFLTCHVLDKADSNQLKSMRGLADFIAVKGGNISLNKFAVNHKSVDFIVHPVSSGKLEIDTAIARLAKENNVKLNFMLSDFLSVEGFHRSMMFKNALMAVKLLKKFKAEALFFSGAKEASGLRQPKDLAGLAFLLGFTPEQAKRLAEKVPGKMVERCLK